MRSLFFAAAIILAVTLPGLASDEGTIGPKVQKACTTCHTLDRICKKLGTRDEEGWRTTVSRMVKRRPVLQGDDVEAAIRYLASLPAGSGDICR